MLSKPMSKFNILELARRFSEEGMWLGRGVLLIIFYLVMALAIDLYIIYTMAKAMTI